MRNVATKFVEEKNTF